MERGEKVGLVQVLTLMKAGYSPAQISKKYNIPKQTISYTVGKLKKAGCIERIGYGTWRYIKDLKEVRNLTTRQGSKLKEIRGHAFIWRIEFMHPFDWKQVVRSYRKKKLTFQLICSNQVYRTIFKNRKIWLNKKGLTIYEAMDFYGKSSFQVKGNAVYQMDKLIKDFLKELNQKFRSYRFSTSREHYGMIRNELARQYNNKKEKMHIRGEEGTIWLWIDDSMGLGELETRHPVISRQVQNYWNDHKKHKFEVTPSFVLKTLAQQTEMIGKNAQHLEFHAENMRTHISAVQKLGKGVNELTKVVKELKK